MCASYGLDPRLGDYKSLVRAGDEVAIESLREWAKTNANELLRPTGKNLRNLNPIIRGDRAVEFAWWGFLIGGEPSRFPSINTRSERLKEKPGNANGRALVPATSWLEMQKPSRDWYSFDTGEVFAMAAVTQSGRPTGGDWLTCYSIVMQPAREDLVDLHDRMPLLIPEDFYDDWLDPDRMGDPELIEAALAASQRIVAQVSASLAPPR